MPITLPDGIRLSGGNYGGYVRNGDVFELKDEAGVVVDSVSFTTHAPSIVKINEWCYDYALGTTSLMADFCGMSVV